MRAGGSRSGSRGAAATCGHSRRRIERGALDAPIALVFADRDCPALDWARRPGSTRRSIPRLGARTRRSRRGGRRAGRDRRGRGTPTPSSSPASCASSARSSSRPSPVAILNVHPSLLPAFPGAHAVRDALAARGGRHRRHGPPRRRHARRRPDRPRRSACRPAGRQRGDAARADPRGRAPAPAPGGRAPAGRRAARSTDGRVTIDAARAAEAAPVPRRALLSVSDKTGLVPFAAGLVARGFELVSTGGTARALREAGLPVTDVAAVTGFPEMLDGRVKTLHPRVHAGILADRRLAAHREQLAAAAIEPFELVVVNLYPFAAAAERALRGELDLDGLVEEIDIGGPSMVRAAAKNHASVAIVTDARPVRAGPRRPRRRGGRPGRAPRGARRRGLPPHGRLRRPDRRGAARSAWRRRAWRCPTSRACPARPTRSRPALMIDPREGRDAPLRGEPPPAGGPLPAPGRRPRPTARSPPVSRRSRARRSATTTSSTARRRRGIGRLLHGPACVIVKHTNPCGAAERETLAAAWDDALAADPVSRLRRRRRPHPTGRPRRSRSGSRPDLPRGGRGARRSSRPRSRSWRRSRTCAWSSTRRWAAASPPVPPSPTGSLRSAGGAVLVTAPDTAPDDPTAWTVATRRAPDRRRAARPRPRLAPGPRRHLQRDRARPGRHAHRHRLRPDEPGRRRPAGRGQGDGSPRGASGSSAPPARRMPSTRSRTRSRPASRPGVTAFVQPGGSVRDAEAIAAADAAGATMLMTGVRHFRH